MNLLLHCLRNILLIKISDQENANQLGNPIIRRPKGRPHGVTRYRNSLKELKFNESIGGNKNQQNKCNNIGHNHTICPLKQRNENHYHN
ncbi:2166_t:CDS:2 [Funneliformis mosseae]|uniref:2166_t:CDS:1 n=1 Tax=Funneliformis mosseae TaxID=27381 RepID=A0A9N9A7M2_FUNMO|nr:2166_t:CDS:2 [Funneliformis mosseae]